MPSQVTVPHRVWRAGFGVALLFSTLIACGPQPWNNPYPVGEGRENVLYSAFSERPKHLDPAQSYSSNEVVFTAQIYEPPLQYHYLKRPYTLVPLAAAEMPRARYLDAAHRPLPDDADPARIAYSVYDIRIKPGMRYQPHPALARDAQGRLRYHALTTADLEDVDTLADFPATGTREVTAADYVYEIKRLANPHIHSPILGVMGAYIVGLHELAARLSKDYPPESKGYVDLERYDLAGAQVVDRYIYRITLRGKYPQLLYWLAMPFFAPVPPEAERFYSQPGMAEKNLSLDWYPIGSGPYRLTVNNPNRQMVLEKNPYFHGERYPADGAADLARRGLLKDAGRPLPFIDRVVYTLEPEDIPYWNKFLQGYYDVSGVSSDSFDQAIQFGGGSEVNVTDALQQKGIALEAAVAPTIFYVGFNMLDPVVGGTGERARKLRQAISIALDQEEYISIFLNGRGIPAQGPIPPGIFGYRDDASGINRYIYDWAGDHAQRKPMAAARALLAEAGYPGGVDRSTGAPLVLYFDTTAAGPDDKSRLDWMRKQFAQLKIQLAVRDSDYNRFQDKMLKGTAQLFQWGWNADYPDPENFLFLLYGPNAKVGKNGENAANYHNSAFDRLFERMKLMDNGPQRQAIIDEMVAIARRDAPWVWGFHPKQFSLRHAWYHNAYAHQIANNTLKYKRIDPILRSRMRAQWNAPVLGPVGWGLGFLVALTLPAFYSYFRRERRPRFRNARNAGRQ